MKKDLNLNFNFEETITEHGQLYSKLQELREESNITKQESNNTSVSKTCSKCGETYTVSSEKELAEYFYYLDKEQGTLRKQCKECHRQKSRQNRGTNEKKHKVKEHKVKVSTRIPKNKSGVRFENDMYVKTCGKCKHTYESETESGLTKYFAYRNKKENILDSRCKECKRIDNQKYVQNPENKAKKLENFKKWTAKNKEKVKEYSESKKEVLNAHRALSDITALSTEELMFFKEKIESKLNEINQELDNRNKESL